MEENTTLTLNVTHLLEIAKIAARKAGKFLISRLGAAKIEHQKSLHDDLLDTDLEAEKLILTTLKAGTPDIGILSEEAGSDGEHEHYWIVDPLDGSANFQHGSPTFAIAIALVSKKTTIGGIIYIPMRDEMFTAIQHKGAYLNDSRIVVSRIAALDEAIAHVGDPVIDSDKDATNAYITDLSKLTREARRVRMIGTAATDLAYVSCGRADLLINYTPKPWDIEAGKLLLLEAGGKVSIKQYPNDKTLFLYTNGHVHQAAESLLIPTKSKD